MPINENDTEEDVKIDENTESKSAVKESDFSYSRKDSLGLIDISNGGFDTTLWNGSSYSDIEYLINSLPEVSHSSTLRELLVNSLLTKGDKILSYKCNLSIINISFLIL